MTFQTKKLIIYSIALTLIGCGTRDRVVLIRGIVPKNESCFLDVATQSFDHRPRPVAGSFEQDYTIAGFRESFTVIEVSCDRKVLLRKLDVPLESVIELGELSAQDDNMR